MRLIGLKIDRMDPSIQKVLKQGWYPFGDYSEPKADGYLCVESISRVEKSLYRLRHEQPEVSVSCVVGMNGSGKSTILEIIFRILNNLAVTQCKKMPNLVGTDMEFAYGVYADLYCECDSYINVIRCRDAEVSCYRYKVSEKMFPLLEENGNAEDILSRLFYTIGVNYSLYAFNQETFKSRETERINGDWLTSVFHKNDGYLAPLTIVPFRNEGEISMAKENELATQRIIALSILSRSKGRQFPEGYYPDKLHYALNHNFSKEKFARFKNSFQSICVWLSLDNLITHFEEAWIWLFKEVTLNIKRPTFSDEYRLALFYLAYKAAKISLTYNDYYQILGVHEMKRLYDEKKQDSLENYVKNELKTNTKAVVMGLYQNKDHITLKIHQTLLYLQELYWSGNKNDWNVMQLLNDKEPKTYDDVVMTLPPPFYDIDVTYKRARRRKNKRWRRDELWDENTSWNDDKGASFRLSAMSSGERQVLVTISYVLYHIKNLQSVDKTVYRVPYHHICIIFDEVELYFHPDYQRRFLSMLIESLSWASIDRRRIRSIHILIATHSPFVLTDVLTERTLYLREGLREEVMEQTFGGNYYDLLDNSFFFRTTAIGEISSKAIRRWVSQHDHQNIKHSDEIMNMVGDPYVKRYLQTDHIENFIQDVSLETTDK